MGKAALNAFFGHAMCLLSEQPSGEIVWLVEGGDHPGSEGSDFRKFYGNAKRDPVARVTHKIEAHSFAKA